MSDAKSTVLQNQVIEHNFGGVAYAQPLAWWLALYSVNPTDSVNASSPTPITGLVQITAAGANPTWTRNGNRANNTYDIQFPAVPAAQTWVVSHFAIFDNSSAGRPLYYGAFSTTKTLEEGDIFLIQSGSLVIREL